MDTILFLCIVTLSVLLQCSANHLSGSYYRRYPYNMPPRPSTPKPKPTTTSTTTTTAAGEYEPPEMEGVSSTTTTTAKPTVKTTTKKAPHPYYQYPPYNYNQHYRQPPYNAQHVQGGSYPYNYHNPQGGNYPHTYQHGRQQQPYNQQTHTKQQSQHPYHQQHQQPPNQQIQHPYYKQANNQQPHYQQSHNQQPHNQQATNQQPHNQQASNQQPHNQQASNQQPYDQHTGYNPNALSNQQKQNHNQYQQTTMSYQQYQQKYLHGYQAGQNQQQRQQNQQHYYNQQPSMQRNQHRPNSIPTPPPNKPPPNKPRQQVLPNNQHVFHNNVQDWGHAATNKKPELSLTGKISPASLTRQQGWGNGPQAPINVYQQQTQPIQTQLPTMQNIKNQPVQGPILANSVQPLNQQGQVQQNTYVPNAVEQQRQQLTPIQQAQQVPITTQQAAVQRQVPLNANLMNQYVQAIQKLQAQMNNIKPSNPPYTALTAQQQSIQQQNVVVKPIRREFQQPSQQNQLIPDKQAIKDMFSTPISVAPKLAGTQQTKIKNSFNKVFGVTKPPTTINPFMDLFGLNNHGFARTTAPTPAVPTPDPFFSMAQSFETMLRTGYAASALTGQTPMFSPLFEF
ncbi:putative mediator of RNA polymerase II transcription subunit 26 isoform X2 [Mytilus trossulus]